VIFREQHVETRHDEEGEGRPDGHAADENASDRIARRSAWARHERQRQAALSYRFVRSCDWMEAVRTATRPIRTLASWVAALKKDTASRRADARDSVAFQCNICGRTAHAASTRFTREEPTCKCGSTVRERAIIHVLSEALFGESLIIDDMPCRRELAGADMSGSERYARRLKKKLGYVNTFLHKRPVLDILAPSAEWRSSCDFLISSDVFEHIPPPVSRAFENARGLLKPGGVLVFTVPYLPAGETKEHFPELHRYSIEEKDGERFLVNTTSDGRAQRFDNLVFHGGEGSTLEMRIFSEAGVLAELERARFTDVRVHRESCERLGILWPEPWSLPISARRPLRAGA
jgi:SAM-dependent methyltransferase